LTERPDCDEEINRIRTEKVIKAASQVLISKKNDNHDQNQDEKSTLNDNPLQSRTYDGPVNEFTNDDLNFTCTFPHLFILGKAYGSTVSNWSHQKKMHLLMQFSQIQSSDKLFLAYIFDLCKRHESINGISTHVKNKPGTIKKFGELMKNNKFEKELEIAKADPESKEAKEVLKQILPILEFAGKKSSFGAFEKRKQFKKYTIYQEDMVPHIYFLQCLLMISIILLQLEWH